MYAKILKELSKLVAPMLSIIFKILYKTGCIPAKWKEASISAIYKKGDKYGILNQRTFIKIF